MTYISPQLREAVREQADGRCEYCRFPASFHPHPFQVDHIRAVRHGGSNDLSNLALACLRCNLMKGSDVGSYDEETDEFTPFFNPRLQNWGEHFSV